MAKSTPKGRGALIVVSLLVIGGVVAYVLYRRRKSSMMDTGSTPPPTDLGSSTGGGSAVGYTFPFKSVEEGNRFRAWVNDNYPSVAKEISLDRAGQLNAYLQKAWERLGGTYNLSMVAKNLGAVIGNNTVNVTFNGGKNRAVFFDNGRFAIATADNKLVMKGSYSNGGFNLVADNNKTAMGSSVWTNLANIIR